MENWGGYTPILDVSVPPPSFPQTVLHFHLGGLRPLRPPSQEKEQGLGEEAGTFLPFLNGEARRAGAKPLRAACGPVAGRASSGHVQALIPRPGSKGGPMWAIQCDARPFKR